ncbi:MAG: pheromone processing endoprotease [Chrysothrix sp. TS-e1954]|nr:MAG: pheromone processing endoprotease [Chrysothrix sp. TS-e1954]
MRLSWLPCFLTLSQVALSGALRPRSYDTHDYYAVHLSPTTSPEALAEHLGLEFDGQIGDLQDHYLLRRTRDDQDIVQDAVYAHKRRKRRRDTGYQNQLLDGVHFHQKQEVKKRLVKRVPPPPNGLMLKQAPPKDDADSNSNATQIGIDLAEELEISDPIFHEQWHLYNPVQLGHDLNVSGVWKQGVTGKNATVCIVDDGLDMDSEDLKANYFAAGSYDFNDQVDEPRPRLSDDRHGTRCAGEVAAAKNNVCGVGVAWDARIAGIRILSKAISDADEAAAMTYGFQETDIYSCSWGPPDDGKEMGEPGILIKRAMVTAIQQGRQGLGTIYVFAAGNGAASDDNCNFDGYTNSIYSITVGAIDRAGLHPYYSEKCSAQLVVTYSSGSGDAIHTTDVGVDKCYANHGGTSAAGPLAVGIFALVLEVRPDLTWRDMQWLSVNTAVKLNNTSDWQETPYGKSYSHQYGYGKLDAYAVVEAAKEFESVKPQAWYVSPWQHIRHTIPQGDVGLHSTFTVTEKMLKNANLERIEHVTVTMNIEHTRRGDLSVELQSPTGIISHLSTARRNDAFAGGYDDWTFMSVAHWGESGTGAWTIVVKDTVKNEHNGTFVDWKLNLFGECVDAEQQGLLPLPSATDDDDHDREDGDVATKTIRPTTTEEPGENPTDHQHRPVNNKPTAGEVTTTASFEPPTMATALPGPDVEHDDETQPTATASSPAASATSTAPPDSFLPSPFPTFGVSKHTQIWIYAAVAAILAFLVSLSVYLYMARRRRLRNLARENYEFDVLDDASDGDSDDDGEGKRRLVNGNAAKRRGSKMQGKRRAGELYDAFAGESDEEVFSDDERYRDVDEAVDEKRDARGPGLSDEEETSSGSGSGQRR